MSSSELPSWLQPALVLASLHTRLNGEGVRWQGGPLRRAANRSPPGGRGVGGRSGGAAGAADGLPLPPVLTASRLSLVSDCAVPLRANRRTAVPCFSLGSAPLSRSRLPAATVPPVRPSALRYLVLARHRSSRPPASRTRLLCASPYAKHFVECHAPARAS